MDSSTFSYPSTDLWKPVTSRSCKRRRGKPHSDSWFRVLQLETRNQKLRTFTSSNHISQNSRLFTEDFHHRKQGLSPQAPPTNRHSYGVKSPHTISKINLNPTKTFILREPRRIHHQNCTISQKPRFTSEIITLFGVSPQLSTALFW
jgi:hypothetical protein